MFSSPDFDFTNFKVSDFAPPQEHNYGSHPFDESYFQEHRKEQYDASVEITEHLCNDKNVIVHAEEKSGKRIMCEAASLLYPDAKHIFATCLNRKDIKPQLEEQEKAQAATREGLEEKITANG